MPSTAHHVDPLIGATRAEIRREDARDGGGSTCMIVFFSFDSSIFPLCLVIMMEDDGIMGFQDLKLQDVERWSSFDHDSRYQICQSVYRVPHFHRTSTILAK